jgi:hypothetical protein
MIQHPYTEYANKKLLWLPTDTKERYDQNLKDNYNLLDQFGWVDSTISYQFNSLGFRSEEFTKSDNAVFLGCSHTVGVGLPLENTWPYYVSQALNLKCYNLGIGGGSLDLAFRLSYYLLKELQPKFVFLLCPGRFRMELFEGNDLISFLPANSDGHKKLNYFYKCYLENDYNHFLNQQKNILAIKTLCNDLNIKFIYINDPEIDQNKTDLARDLMHKGPKSHFNLAQRFLNML